MKSILQIKKILYSDDGYMLVIEKELSFEHALLRNLFLFNKEFEIDNAYLIQDIKMGSIKGQLYFYSNSIQFYNIGKLRNKEDLENISEKLAKLGFKTEGV